MSAPIDDGGPAFPMQVKLANGTDNYRGMSLRDWFAGQALAGYISNHKACEQLSSVGKNTPHFYAVLTYAMADAMLAARKESK